LRGKSLIFRVRNWVIVAILAVTACGCAVSKKTVAPPTQAGPVLDATKAELVEKYNRQAKAIQSLNARVTLKATAGSQYSGVVEQYHEVNGFILAQRPAKIRVIGQAPIVNKNIFDMVSDGETFRILIPSKNTFITGPAKLEKPAKKPIENLRPQHLVDALFWNSIREDAPVIFEESDDSGGRGYILTVLHGTRGETNFEIASRIRFERTDLNVSRIENFEAGGKLESVVHYADWQPAGDAQFAHDIRVERPRDDYQLAIGVTKVTVNEALTPEQFRLEQPPGTKLVDVEKDEKESQP
jgi:outer membrane lipoprotein-sorting protein